MQSRPEFKGVESARSPETIVFGTLVDVDDQVHHTPKNDPPKPSAETETRRNIGSTVFGMAHEVGYARVSKREQNPDAQEAELRAADGQLRADRMAGGGTADIPVALERA